MSTMSTTPVRTQSNGLARAFQALVATRHDYGALVARLALGLVIFPHGAQKLLGWFGGYGFTGTMGFFTAQMGIPAPIAFLVIIGESLGALALVAGFLGRFSAASIALIMAGAALMAHLPFGFFVDWNGTQGGQGVEFHLLAIGLALVVALKGSGAFSIDRLFTRK